MRRAARPLLSIVPSNRGDAELRFAPTRGPSCGVPRGTRPRRCCLEAFQCAEPRAPAGDVSRGTRNRRRWLRGGSALRRTGGPVCDGSTPTRKSPRWALAGRDAPSPPRGYRGSAVQRMALRSRCAEPQARAACDVSTLTRIAGLWLERSRCAEPRARGLRCFRVHQMAPAGSPIARATRPGFAMFPREQDGAAVLRCPNREPGRAMFT